MPIIRHLLKNPQFSAAEIYQNATKKISDYFSGIPEVHTVYQMGNISIPGISDLDILVVIKSDYTIPYFDVSKFLNDREQYTLMHSVFIVNETFWHYRHFFYIYDNLKLLGGNELTDLTVDPSPEFRKLLHKRFAIQHILKVYVSICAQLSVYSLKVRPLLCELHALRYDQKALAIWLTPSINDTFQEYCQRIAALRNHWFSSTEAQVQKQLFEICRELPPFLKQVLLHINTKLDGNHFKNRQRQQLQLKLSYHRHIHSQNGSSPDLYGHNPSPLRWLGLLSVPTEQWRIKIHNRLSAYHLEIPFSLFSFISNEFNHPLYATFQVDIQARQNILNSSIIQQIGQNGYAIPILDFLNFQI